MRRVARLRVPDGVAQSIRKLHPSLKRKIRGGFDAIAADPESGKVLREELEGLRSLRVGRFRIVYRVGARGVLEIVAVGPRDRIYEETYRLIAGSK